MAGLVLVGFDGFSMGDAELAAATFVAELDFERRTEASQFLDGYESVNGPLDARAHKRLAKTLHPTRSLRLDAGDRAQSMRSTPLEHVGCHPGGKTIKSRRHLSHNFRERRRGFGGQRPIW